MALVIGNGAYTHVPFLANPGNDARAVGASIHRLGYAVTRIEDAGYDAVRIPVKVITDSGGMSSGRRR